MLQKRRGRRIGIYLLLLAMVLVGCTPKSEPPQAQQTPVLEPTPTPASVRTAASISKSMLGFVVPDSKDIHICTVMHGFLRTAENMGYPAKLYRASAGQAAVAAVEQAAAEGCLGLLIWNKDGANADAIARAAALSLPVVSPYYESTGVRASVVADVDGYHEEVALALAERMVERECKAGKILVYGHAPLDAHNAFQKAVATYYPQFNTGHLTRTQYNQEAAIEELARYILWNRDIKGLFCTDTDGALIAVRAREKASADFKKNGAPEAPNASPKPEQTPVSYAATPGPTPVPAGLVKSIIISVGGYGLNEDTVSLMNKNDIYLFVLEPYYEASAHAVMLLDRLLNQESVPETYRLNMPIVRMATLEKHVLINEQVKDWFDLS